MLPFLLTFGSICFLIVCGIRMSLYLYKQGVFGKRGYGNTLRHQVEEERGFQPYTNVIGADAASSRYARLGLLVCLGGVIVVVMLITMLISAVLH